MTFDSLPTDQDLSDSPAERSAETIGITHRDGCNGGIFFSMSLAPIANALTLLNMFDL